MINITFWLWYNSSHPMTCFTIDSLNIKVLGNIFSLFVVSLFMMLLIFTCLLSLDSQTSSWLSLSWWSKSFPELKINHQSDQNFHDLKKIFIYRIYLSRVWIGFAVFYYKLVFQEADSYHRLLSVLCVSRVLPLWYIKLFWGLRSWKNYSLTGSGSNVIQSPEAATGGVLKNFAKFTWKHLC